MTTFIPAAFDGAAAGYDDAFTRRRLGRWLRAAVWEQLAAFQPGETVLDLGCGTGEDAVWLARRGVRVVATDAAPAMLAVARQKAVAAGVADRVAFTPLDLAAPLSPSPDALLPGHWPLATDHFVGVYSNFGALNCLADRRPLAAALAGWLRPGGRLVLVVMGPCCPWEVVWHLARGEVGTATRRWRGGGRARVGGGATTPVWYPSPRRLRAEFAPAFRARRMVGLGALLPPTHLGHLVERWPGFSGWLAGLERRLGHRFPLTWLNDHYLVVLERT